MAGSHISPSGCERDVDEAVDTSPLSLVASGASGLSEQLSGRIESHFEAKPEYVREGLLAASTAVGLEVQAWAHRRRNGRAGQPEGPARPRPDRQPGMAPCRAR